MFIKKQHGDVVYYVSDALERTGAVLHGFSTRAGGVSGGIYSTMNLRMSCGDSRENVLTNFRRFAEAVGTEADKLVLSHQVHEDKIIEVTEADWGNGILYENKFESADALITNRRGVPLIVFFADCVPVLIADAVTGAVAAVHSGWRGTAACICEKTVRKMISRFGCRPENITAAVGPSIGVCCYEVGEEVAERFLNSFGDGTVKSCGGKYRVNMQEAVRIQLNRCGVPDENIDNSGICTCCNSEELFSHRKTNGRRGVMGAIIMIKQESNS